MDSIVQYFIFLSDINQLGNEILVYSNILISNTEGFISGESGVENGSHLHKFN